MDLSICFSLDFLSLDSDSESESESDKEKFTNVFRFRGAVVGFTGVSKAEEEEVQKGLMKSWVLWLETEKRDWD